MNDIFLHRNGRIEVRPPLEIEGRYYSEGIVSPVTWNGPDGLPRASYTTREWMVIVPRHNGHGIQVFKEVG